MDFLTLKIMNTITPQYIKPIMQTTEDKTPAITFAFTLIGIIAAVLNFILTTINI